jgi:hypothetical protein
MKILGGSIHPENALDFVSLFAVEFIVATPIDFLFGRGRLQLSSTFQQKMRI